MAKLNDSQLLLLSNLVYLNAPQDYANKTISKLINNVLNDKNRFDRYCTTGVAYMSADEWREILTHISKDTVLMGLTIKDVVHQELVVTHEDGKPVTYDDGTPKTDTGMFVATFVDAEDNATVVFRGTGGDMEWRDNGMGGYLSDTPQQKAALEYIESLPKSYRGITVTGHSKGGNKAQYVAILSDRVERCVSFDGQGFSEEFYEKYSMNITLFSRKIKSISASKDYVNCLLTPIPPYYDDVNYEIVFNREYIDTGRQEPFIYYHKPNIMLDSNGTLKPKTEQSAISKLINEFSIYVTTQMKEPYKQQTIDKLMTILMDSSELKEDTLDMLMPALLSGLAFNEFIKKNKWLIEEIDDKLFDEIREGFGEKVELVLLMILARIYPDVFEDDLEQFRKDKSQEQIKKIRESLINFGNLLVNRLKDFERKIGEAISKISSGIEKKWNDLINNISGSAKTLINTKPRDTGNAITKIRPLVSEFFKQLANVIGRFLHTVIINGMGTKTNSTYKSRTGWERIINYWTGNTYKGEISVDIDRITDLGNKIRAFEEIIGESTQRVLNDVGRITEKVSRQYDEYYVRQQVQRINNICERIHNRNKKINDDLWNKLRSLQYAVESYRQKEEDIRRIIDINYFYF